MLLSLMFCVTHCSATMGSVTSVSLGPRMRVFSPSSGTPMFRTLLVTGIAVALEIDRNAVTCAVGNTPSPVGIPSCDTFPRMLLMRIVVTAKLKPPGQVGQAAPGVGRVTPDHWSDDAATSVPY